MMWFSLWHFYTGKWVLWSYSFPACIPYWISNSGVWGACINHLCLRKNNSTFVIFPDYGHQDWVSFSLMRLHLCFSYPPRCCPLTLYCGKCSSSVQIPFRRNYSVWSGKFVVFMGRDEFRIFLFHHLEPSGYILTFIFIKFTFLKNIFCTVAYISMISVGWIKNLNYINNIKYF